MDVNVDKEKCIGCGTCVALCPQVFKMGDDGKAEVKSKDFDKCDVKNVAESCPVEAIKVS